MSGCVAVVLAGGRSSRFGSDKLEARVGGASLLELTLAGLPADAEVIVVGPVRPLSRPVHFIREEPPLGGPAAALVAGLRRAGEFPADPIVVLPGDAPGAGVAAGVLLAALERGSADVVVATDADARVQPLQLALRPSGAVRLLDAAGTDAGRNAAARRLIDALDPPAERVVVPAIGSFDVDTPGQLADWRRHGQQAGADLRNDGCT